MKKIYFSFLAFLFAFTLNAQSLMGDATTLPSSTVGSTDYQLTPSSTDQRGAFWNNTPLDLTNNFSFSAELNFGTQHGPSTDPNDHSTGADGIAFVLQSQGTTALGAIGEGMGYGGITNSFAVEMDTWQNLNRNDIPEDHLAFMKNGDVTHGTVANSDADRYMLGELEDGAWHSFNVSWNAAAKMLTVTLDGVPRTYTGDVAAVIGSNMVTWGFTAATGSALNQHRIRFIAAPDCLPFTVSASVPALGCSAGNTIYLGYGLQSVTATSSPADATTTYKWYMVGEPGVVYTGETFSPTMAGTYYVVATRGNCTASNADHPITITVIDIRCGKNNQDKVYVCHKENGTHGNGTIGENAHSLCVSVNAVAAHLAHGDCLGACPDAEKKTTSVEDMANSFVVFPNPTTNSVKLNIEAANGVRSEVVVRNAQSNIVERKSVIGNAQPSFNLRKYGTGIFVIQIINGSNIITKKVLVQ
ncbi:MAG: T9SS type A sorting domain-containing protein [Ginsengibacter sp.]